MNRARVHCSAPLKIRVQAALTTLVLIPVVLSSARAEPSDDYQCGKGADIRRIEIRFEDEIDQLPCRVIYRPETENQSVGTVSWRGISTLENCQTQARLVVDRLIAEGWSCAILSEAPENEAPEPEVIEAAVDAGAAVLGAEGNKEKADREEVENEIDEPAVLLENPSLGAPPPGLVTLIEQNLDKLDLTLDGTLQAQIAGFSDLNADDIADALVLYTFISPQPAYRQFLAAYLSDGETYQLTSTKPIASSSMDTKNAKIDKIDQGIIKVKLDAFEPGDQSCCPSGVRELSLALRDLELVEIDQSAPIR